MDIAIWVATVLLMATLAVAPAFPVVRRRIGVSEDSPEARAVRAILRTPFSRQRHPAESQASELPSYPWQTSLRQHAPGELRAVPSDFELLRRLESELEDDPWGRANALNMLGFIYERCARFEDAYAAHSEALALFGDDDAGATDTLNNLAVVDARAGRAEVALKRYERVLDAASTLDQKRLADTLNNRGVAFSALRDAERAFADFDASWQLSRKIGHTRTAGKALNNLAVLGLPAPPTGRAIDQLEQALAYRQELGDRRGAAKTYNNLAVCHALTGAYVEAAKALRDALANAQEVDDRMSVLNIRLNQASLVDTPAREDVGDLSAALAETMEGGIKVARELDAETVVLDPRRDRAGAIKSLTASLSSASRSPLTRLDQLSQRIHPTDDRTYSLGR